MEKNKSSQIYCMDELCKYMHHLSPYPPVCWSEESKSQVLLVKVFRGQENLLSNPRTFCLLKMNNTFLQLNLMLQHMYVHSLWETVPLRPPASEICTHTYCSVAFPLTGPYRSIHVSGYCWLNICNLISVIPILIHTYVNRS